jgi:hypothetical protein
MLTSGERHQDGGQQTTSAKGREAGQCTLNG